MKRRAVLAAVLLAVLGLVGASCAGGRSKAAGVASPTNAAAPRLYVAIGASDSRGVGTDEPLRQAWPQDFFRTLPANYRFVNLAVRDATVAAAVADELPIAESLHPAVVTVWLNRNDVLGGVPVASYQADLATVIHGLRASGATVLVANTPPLDGLPAYLSCIDPANHPGDCPAFGSGPVPSPQQVVAAVDQYNTAIAAVVAHEGAKLVDLHRAAGALPAGSTPGSLVGDDGFNPSTAGAQLVASQFVAAFRSP